MVTVVSLTINGEVWAEGWDGGETENGKKGADLKAFKR